MKDLLAVLKALAHESRLRILCALAPRELCVCQITELLGLAPSTVSRHMAALQQAGLVESRKCGRWIHYRLAAPDGASEAAGRALEWAREVAMRTDRARDDARRMAEILRMDPSALCRMQTGRAPRPAGNAPAVRAPSVRRTRGEKR